MLTSSYFFNKSKKRSSIKVSIFTILLIILQLDLFSQAIPQNLTANAGDQQVTFRSDQNAETNIHKYIIYRDETSPAITLLDSVVAFSPPDTFYVDNGLTNSQEYFYRITAYDSTGSESGFSNEVIAIPYPEIISNLPAQNRLNVPKDTVISVTFGADMNASTINSNTFIVHADVTIQIRNILDSVVVNHKLEALEAGQHQWIWDGQSGAGDEFASGIYFLNMKCGDNVTNDIIRVAKY